MMPGLERLARELEDVAFLYVDVGIVKYLRSFISVCIARIRSC